MRARRRARRVERDTDAPVRVLMISNLAELELCVYPDSDKVGVWSPQVKLMNRVSANLDYLDGEVE